MNLEINLRPRESQSSFEKLLPPLLSIVGALVIGAVILLLTNNDPAGVYYYILIDPLLSMGGIIDVFNRTVPLVLAGLAVYVPYKSGLWNIGVEGQIYFSAIAVTWFALQLSLPALAFIGLLLLCGGLAGALWAFIPGYLRAKWDVNEIIVTLMLTFIATRLTQYAVRGPLQAGEGFPASENLPAAAQIPAVDELVPVLGDFPLNVTVFVALGAVIVVFFMEERTLFGYKTRVVGDNPEASDASGISRFRVYIIVMAIGGILAGIIGMYQISVVHTRLQSVVSPGYGFTGIPIALLGRNGAFRVLLASLFFAIMFVGGSTASIISDVPTSILDILEALIILFYIAAIFFQRYAVDLQLMGGDA